MAPHYIKCLTLSVVGFHFATVLRILIDGVREKRRQLFVGIGLVLALGGEAYAQSRIESVYFNWNEKNSFTDPLRGFERTGDNLEEALLREISKAQRSIDLAVFQLNLPNLAKTLVKKKKQGIAVRVVVDNIYRNAPSNLISQDRTFMSREDIRRLDSYLLIADQDGNGHVSHEEILNTDSMAILEQGGVEVIDDTADGSAGSGTMHHKFVVIDGVKVVTGSANFTYSDIFGDIEAPKTRGNANSLMVIHSQDLARAFQEEFEIMWGSSGSRPAFGKDKPQRAPKTFQLNDGTLIRLQFAPKAVGLIHEALGKTTRSADLGLFVFSDQGIADKLYDLSKAGVRIRGLVDGAFAYRWYSEVLDMLGLSMLDTRCRFEPDNRPWQQPVQSVGVPRLPEGDKFHHKYAVLDGESLIYGSYNWSVSAEQLNDETLMHISNSKVAGRFSEEFQRHFNKAFLGSSSWLQNRINSQNHGCTVSSESEIEPQF